MQTDCGNFRHGRLLKWCVHTSTLAHRCRRGGVHPITLADYRDEWLRQAREGQAQSYAEDVEAGIHRATSLTAIEITDTRAIAHKKFNGEIKLSDGGTDRLNWQTLYFCRKVEGQWKLTGFVGYLPYPMGLPTSR
ncbi:hypothetical protein [Devosia sp. BK]|uniref:hypothetical protein n=1 Tax=Devosia sp. BK TaxID=2871706 RepID=UPI00293BDC68|nr:hypothetical protein [Devosia sp. BK]